MGPTDPRARARERLLGLRVAAVCLACACAAARPDAGPSGGPGATEEGPDLFDQALFASGYEDRAEARHARAQLERLLAPILEKVGPVKEERARARGLLEALHGQGGLLGEYDARATTLRELLERRRFNCVSASVLYNLVAPRLGLGVAAELLPTHARVLLAAGTPRGVERLVVETTSPLGFAPDPAAASRILGAVAGPPRDGARALVESRGEVVTTEVLIGAMYVNRASIAQEAGALETAERLFARGEALGGSEKMRRVLRDQRAALLSQLALDDLLAGTTERRLRSVKTLQTALALGPSDPKIAAALVQNLRAALEALFAEQVQRGDEAGLLARLAELEQLPLPPAVRAGVAAFGLSELGRLRLAEGRHEAALDALAQALRQPLERGDARLLDTLRQNQLAALRLAAQEAARRGRHEESLVRLDELRALPHLTDEVRRELERDRVRALLLAASVHLDAGDYARAEALYRLTLASSPEDSVARQNLGALLQRQVAREVEVGRCDELDERLSELRRLLPESRFPSQVEARCLMRRGLARLEAGDFAGAEAQLGLAHELCPEEPAIVQNLGVALLRWARALARPGGCVQVRDLVARVRALGHPAFSAAELDAALGTCR
jgi:tetratricopeptide (TPR) repeat protein